ncbi:hypothetical protein IAR50_002679 [Cryptococcus sp. DSM 104548]
MPHLSVTPGNKSNGLMRRHPSIRAAERSPYGMSDSLSVEVRYVQPSTLYDNQSSHHSISNIKAITHRGEPDRQGARISPLPEEEAQAVLDFERALGAIEDSRSHSTTPRIISPQPMRANSFSNSRLTVPTASKPTSTHTTKTPTTADTGKRSGSSARMPPPYQPSQSGPAPHFQARSNLSSRTFQPNQHAQSASSRTHPQTDNVFNHNHVSTSQPFQDHLLAAQPTSAQQHHAQMPPPIPSHNNNQESAPAESLDHASWADEQSGRGNLQALVFDDDFSVVDFDGESDAGVVKTPMKRVASDANGKSTFNFTPTANNAVKSAKTGPEPRFVIPKPFSDHTSILKGVNPYAIWQERLKVAKEFTHQADWMDTAGLVESQRRKFEDVRENWDRIHNRMSSLLQTKDKVLQCKVALTDRYVDAGDDLAEQCVELQLATRNTNKRRRITK